MTMASGGDGDDTSTGEIPSRKSDLYLHFLYEIVESKINRMQKALDKNFEDFVKNKKGPFRTLIKSLVAELMDETQKKRDEALNKWRECVLKEDERAIAHERHALTVEEYLARNNELMEKLTKVLEQRL